MQDVELLPTGQLRQLNLVPPGILQRKPKSLRHADQAYLSTCEVEQRQVLFQNENSEIVFLTDSD